MPWYAPKRFYATAPTNPKRTLVGVLALAAIVLFVVTATNPAGVVPGIAEAKRDGNEVTITFEGGDRFFWMPSDPTSAVHASDVLAKIPGEQELVKRANYKAIDRTSYDEAEEVGDGNVDYLVEADFLYEVYGNFDGATFTYIDGGQDTGTNFADQIRENSNILLKRLWTQIKSIPAIIWDDLRHIGDDVQGLFKEKADSDGEGAGPGPVTRLVERLKEQWYIFAGLGLLMFVAPFLGMGPLAVGLIGGMALAMGGSMPFYILAGISVVLGVLLDQDGPANVLQEWGLKAAVATGDFTHTFKRAAQGFIVFIAGGIVGLALAYFGHENLVAIVMLATGTLSMLLMFQKGGENSEAGIVRHNKDDKFEEATLKGISWVPGVMILILGLLNGAWLLYLGYDGLAMGFLLLASLVGYCVVFRSVRDLRRFNAEYKRDMGESDSAEIWEDRVEGRVRKAVYGKKHDKFSDYVEGIGLVQKVAYCILLLFTYLSIVAATQGDWLLFSTHFLVGIGLIIAVWFAGKHWSEGKLESKEVPE